MERLINDFDEGFIKIYTYVDILDVFIIVLNPFFICGIGNPWISETTC